MTRTILAVLAAVVLASACAHDEKKPDAPATSTSQPASTTAPSSDAPAPPPPEGPSTPPPPKEPTTPPPPKSTDPDAPPPPKSKTDGKALQKKDTSKMERSGGDDE
jgi:hypothetical protein